MKKTIYVFILRSEWNRWSDIIHLQDMRQQLHKLTEELRNMKETGKTDVAAEVIKKILETIQQTDGNSGTEGRSRYGTLLAIHILDLQRTWPKFYSA